MITISESFTRIFRRQLITITALIAIVIPALYFVLSYQYLVGSIDADSEFSALMIERLIANNPDSWLFEDIRMKELLLRHMDSDNKDFRRIRDRKGNIVTQVGNVPEAPFISRSHLVYYAGQNVAYIEISRSILPLLITTATISVASLLFSILLFIVLRIYPPKMIREALTSILKSERRLRRAEHVAHAGNFEYVLKSGMISISEGAARITGLEAGERPFAELRKIMLPEYAHATDIALMELIERDKPFNIRFKVRRQSDDEIHDIESIAEYDSKKGVVFGVIHDITEHLRTEKEKIKLQMQLLQAQKMETIGQLTSGIAHDFNNILSCITGFAYILKRQLKNDHSRAENVDAIMESVERAANLTQNLLAFGREQHGNPQPMDINETIRKTKKMLKTLVCEDIQICMELTERNAVIFADTIQVTQILMNLASNARDSMSQGGLLTISTERVCADDLLLEIDDGSAAENYVLISISDTGTGMDENTREKIFDPFFTTKDIGKGTGLGLSIVFGIVRQHKGFIEVESKVGEGTTFRIYFPALKDNIPQKATENSCAIGSFSGTVLLADDDAQMRRSLSGILKSFGFSVVEAVDGNDATNQFRAHNGNIDLILMDVMMPSKNGVAAYEEISALRPDVKVIFISGYSGSYLSGKTLMNEGAHFITKPFSPQKLHDEINLVLNKL
jgi:PAS domain S-box-containing protein